LPLKNAELVKIRKYSELNCDKLEQKCLVDPRARKLVPEHNYPKQKIDKQFLLTVFFTLKNKN